MTRQGGNVEAQHPCCTGTGAAIPHYHGDTSSAKAQATSMRFRQFPHLYKRKHSPHFGPAFIGYAVSRSKWISQILVSPIPRNVSGKPLSLPSWYLICNVFVQVLIREPTRGRLLRSQEPISDTDVIQDIGNGVTVGLIGSLDFVAGCRTLNGLGSPTPQLLERDLGRWGQGHGGQKVVRQEADKYIDGPPVSDFLFASAARSSSQFSPAFRFQPNAKMQESTIHNMSRGLCRLLQTLLKQGRGMADLITNSIPHSLVFRRILGPLAILGTCYGVNRLLNRLVLNTRTGAHLWDWKKEIVLITGGSGGMGSHMVKQFAQRDVQVVSFDIQPPKQALPANARYYQVDVTSPDAIHEAAEQVRRDIGDPTVLINNAGVVLGKDILSCSKDQVKRMFDVNILAHFWLSQEFLPSMIKQQHGHIVTMASIASFITIASNVDYSCTKAGLTAFHEGLAQDLKHRYNTRNVLTRYV